MKKHIILFILAAIVMSCGSRNSSGQSSEIKLSPDETETPAQEEVREEEPSSSSPNLRQKVSLGDIDEFFSVKSCTIESDAEEKGIDKLKDITGTITLVIQRNHKNMNYSISDLRYSPMIRCGIPGSSDVVFMGSANIKELFSMEKGEETTLEFAVSGYDPISEYGSYSEEEKLAKRSAHFNAMIKPKNFDCIDIDASITSSAKERER